METLLARPPAAATSRLHRPPRAYPNRLREFREARGITADQMCEFIPCSRPTLSIAETKRSKAIGSDNWLRISEWFDVDLRDLMGRR